jgi:NAD(P)-dependent dehydrogenase (short-subunit alcohol dehydrogenase family)
MPLDVGLVGAVRGGALLRWGSTARTRGPGVAVVTGGSAGLGRAISRELARAGWDVAVLGRGADGLAATVDEVHLAGRRALSAMVDVADAQAVEAATDRIGAELGPIEVWVNNAMASVFAEFLDATPAEFERATAVTYLGTVNGTRAALRWMLPRDSGHVVQVGSALAYRGSRCRRPTAAKHAMVGMTSILAELVYRGSHVRVSMVHMPALNTVQFNWVRSKLPRHPQPVPPIYHRRWRRAVRRVVQHPRRNTCGTPTAATTRNRLPAPADWYLAGRDTTASRLRRCRAGAARQPFAPCLVTTAPAGRQRPGSRYKRRSVAGQHRLPVGAALPATAALAARPRARR